MAKVTIDH